MYCSGWVGGGSGYPAGASAEERAVTASLFIACEQALLFGRVKRVSRERASERRSHEGARVLARLASLTQIRVLARRLACSRRLDRGNGGNRCEETPGIGHVTARL